MVSITPVVLDGNGFHGSISGPMDEVVAKLKKADPGAEILFQGKSETRIIVGGVLYSLRTVVYVNIYLSTLEEVREIMGVLEPVEV